MLKKAYRFLAAFSDAAQKLLQVLLFLLVTTCLCSTFLQVINRYIIVKISDVSLSFTDELSRYSIVWVTYLALGLCLKDNSMASLNLLYDRLHGRAKAALYLLTRIVMAIFLFVGVKYGLELTELQRIFTSSLLKIPGAFLYSAPLIGCLLLSYEWLCEVLGVLCGEIEPFAGREKAAQIDPYEKGGGL